MDFKNRPPRKPGQVITDPVEIFRRLPKPPGINDLYMSQAEVLSAWYERREAKDVVLKLHTGGGKTLVGLLIARSILNEKRKPVVYLVPTNQLAEQTLAKAKEYNIPAVGYPKGEDFPGDFHDGQSVMVCNYHALFNGKSRFGTLDGARDTIQLGGIVLDDAHVAFSTVRDQFTLSISRLDNKETYATLTNMFRADFQALGRGGTFDDIVQDTGDIGVIEVPYWSWREKGARAKDFLRDQYASEKPLPWYFLRDAFEHCHALISSKAFVITPILPLVDLVPAFAECPRRIFMSATISDDSAIVRTFDADNDAVKKPIISRSLAGVSERMVLIPELMPVAAPETLVEKIAEWVAKSQKLGTIVLTPSEKVAKRWQSVGRYASTSEQVNQSVKALVEETDRGPIVFANRYDGIDLPGNACRLVIIAGQPRGVGEYDLWRSTVLTGGTAINASIAQRIEQGMGRAARGPSDWCVILLVGKDLTGWISRESNQALLTTSTRAQLAIGMDISRDVKDRKDFGDTLTRAFTRDPGWMEYHAESLADLTESAEVAADHIEVAASERKAFRLVRDGYFEQAISRLEKTATVNNLEPSTKGWLLQQAARAATFWEQEERAAELQREAYASNNRLLRPKVIKPFTPPAMPGSQAQRIVKNVGQYVFRRGFLADFDEVVSHLAPEASSNQFEQALADLGALLGFQTSRPDHESPGEGPDGLWFLTESLALLLEAKSRKKFKNALNKGDLGQLLVAENWFKRTHQGCSYVSASVLPRATATKQAETGDVRAFTYERLAALCSDARTLFETLCESSVSEAELVLRCEKLLTDTHLRPDALVKHYFEDFERVE